MWFYCHPSKHLVASGSRDVDLSRSGWVLGTRNLLTTSGTQGSLTNEQHLYRDPSYFTGGVGSVLFSTDLSLRRQLYPPLGVTFQFLTGPVRDDGDRPGYPVTLHSLTQDGDLVLCKCGTVDSKPIRRTPHLRDTIHGSNRGRQRHSRGRVRPPETLGPGETVLSKRDPIRGSSGV